MKVVLVIDKPLSCSECPCCIIRCDKNGGYTSAKCQASYDDGGYVDEITFDIPSWCPLKPMPQRYDEDVMREQKGWNRCLDEIIGKTK